MNYGPFEIPIKEQWLVVGCGPTAANSLKYIEEHPDVGVMTLNMAIASPIPKVDVAIIVHYENVIRAEYYFNKASQIYLSDPCPVGCLVGKGWKEKPAQELYFPSVAERCRIYKRIDTIEPALKDENALYGQATVANTAAHLLYKNGVKEILTAGIDGGKGNDANFCNYPTTVKAERDKTEMTWRIELFDKTCQRFGIKRTKI